MTKSILLSPHSPFPRLLLIITFFSAASLVPLIGLLFLVTLPLVLYILCILNDQTKTLIAFLAVICTITLLLSFMHSILPALAVGVMGFSGMIMAWSTRKNHAIEAIVFIPALFILFMIALYFIAGSMQLSISPWQLIENHIKEAVEINMKLYSQLSLTAEEINAMNAGKPHIIKIFKGIFPALCVIAVLFITWINALFGSKLLGKTGIILPGFLALTEWQAPPWLVWFFIAGGGMSFLPQTPLSLSGINIVLTASFIYFLQGIAIVGFFFQQKNISFFFRFLFYFLIAIQQILMIAIAAVGFFDIWIDFRKYFRNNKATD